MIFVFWVCFEGKLYLCVRVFILSEGFFIYGLFFVIIFFNSLFIIVLFIKINISLNVIFLLKN